MLLLLNISNQINSYVFLENKIKEGLYFFIILFLNNV